MFPFDDPLAKGAPAPAVRSQARQWSGGMVRVLELDDDLLAGLDPESSVHARAHAVAPTLKVSTGAWQPPLGDRCKRMLGLLVIDGLMTRCVTVNGVQCPELLGRGDLLRPWQEPADDFACRQATSWQVIQPLTLAVLDGRFAEALRRWPTIIDALLSRTVDRSSRLALRAALPQIRRADERLRLLFADMAARWGRVTPRGVVVPLPLTNQLLAQLACLRRPTVSTTMTRFAQTGEVVRVGRTGFVLNLVEPGGAAMTDTDTGARIAA